MTFRTTGTPRLVIMTTGLKTGYQPRKVAVEQPKGLTSGSSAAHGKQLYGQFCTACHGTDGEGGTGPALTGKANSELDATIASIKNPKQPMPKLYPSPLSEEDVRAVATYVQSLR